MLSLHLGNVPSEPLSVSRSSSSLDSYSSLHRLLCLKVDITARLLLLKRRGLLCLVHLLRLAFLHRHHCARIPAIGGQDLAHGSPVAYVALLERRCRGGCWTGSVVVVDYCGARVDFVGDVGDCAGGGGVGDDEHADAGVRCG